MPQIRKSIFIHYSAAQMFDLVADIERYPDFLPWCCGAQVRPLDNHQVEATVEIDFHGLRSCFVTRNTHQRPAEIALNLVSGPFRSLTGYWRFTPLRPAACKVEFALDYAFASGLLGRAIAPVFELIATSLIDSFAKRAAQLYGATP
jgi:ribosome-associated toxin RatA of RatAB toxin-antitoxin module